MRVVVRAPVFPTEDPQKVMGAVSAVFPGVDARFEDRYVVGESDDPRVLERFKEVLRSRRVRVAVEEILRENWRDGKTHIDLNKQDAVKGIINVAEESPLGVIHVEFYLPLEEIHSLVWLGDSSGD